MDLSDSSLTSTSLAVRDTCVEISGLLAGLSLSSDQLIAFVIQYLPYHGRESTIQLAMHFFLDGPSAGNFGGHDLPGVNHGLDTLPQTPTSPLAQQSNFDSVNHHLTGPHDRVVEERNDDLVECQCCFTDGLLQSFVHCPERHSFCTTCIQTHVATQLQQLNTDIKCMDSSNAGCLALFLPSEIRSSLPPNLLTLFDNLIQRKEIKAASLENLEECPFCDFACVMEGSLEESPVFSCQDLDRCGVESCRICRARAHSGSPCQEPNQMALGERTWIEEEMTKALIRKCPKCEAAFIKEDGVGLHRMYRRLGTDRPSLPSATK